MLCTMMYNYVDIFSVHLNSYIFQNFDVNVLGIDLSCNMINIALERLNEIKESRVSHSLRVVFLLY